MDRYVTIRDVSRLDLKMSSDELSIGVVKVNEGNCKNEDDSDDDMQWNVIYILFLINELIAIVK